MPELPEVETIVRDIMPAMTASRVVRVNVLDPLVLHGLPIPTFTQALLGQKIKRVYRRGKAIVVELENQDKQSFFWVIQLKMTGQMIIHELKDPSPLKETRLIIHLSNGKTLFYNDQRRFGRHWVGSDLLAFKHFSQLGPEPFSEDFNPQYIKAFLATRKRPIKNVLLDHQFVAGIGNIYASEILYRLKINPRKKANRFPLVQCQALHQMIKTVLELAIKHRGSSMRNYRDSKGEKGRFNQLINVYGREHLPCGICHTPIARIVQAGRSTFFCPHCQKK